MMSEPVSILMALLILNSPVEQAIGFYSNGSLTAAVEVPVEAPGLLKLFRPRNRAWGTDDLKALLLESAEWMDQAYPGRDRMQVGDLSVRRGGKITRHASHQNGLDVDLAYYRADFTEQDPEWTGGFKQNFVKGGVLSPNFDVERNWELLKKLTSTGTVTRIFVDPVIKVAMCRFAEGEGEFMESAETLRRLRPYRNHGDHLHVRIQCPQKSPRCRPQAEPPAGHGCNTAAQVDEDEMAGLPF